MLKLDLHLHTLDDPQDRQVWHSAEELIDLAAENGFNVLAITLHEAQLECVEITNYARAKGILLLRGMEQNIEGVHVLLINFEGYLADSLHSFAELRRLKRPEHLVIAPHPYYPQSICLQNRLKENADLFDAVEYSGFFLSWWNPNQKAKQTAEELQLPMIGNSDCHTLEQFGKTYTELDCPQDTTAIIEAIKGGKSKVVAQPLGLIEAIAIVWKVIILGYFPWFDAKKSRKMKSRYEPNYGNK